MSIALVGEAWGEHEERERAPFVGPTGYELTRLLGEAGISRADCYLTNVFNQRPPRNKIEAFCGGKAGGIAGYPALVKGKYVRAEFQPELDRLGDELCEVNPNLVVALGNVAIWALLGQTAISKFRGSTCLSTHTVKGFKVLPTYHPAAIFRQWQFRPVVIIDLIKAERERHYPEIRRPKRQIWIEPTLEDIYDFHRRYVEKAESLSIDIETSGSHVTCVGIAPNSRLALVIPFFDPRRLGRSYWPDRKTERAAYEYIRLVCGSSIPKTFQNGLYDIAFLYRALKIKVMNATHDTMLLHHALHPESLKSLGFMGSVYTDEGSWKQMRGNVTTIKKDE